MLSRLSSKKILLIFVLTLYCLLLGYKLLRLGKHGDGIEYASVARNLADGVGTFWKPYLDDYLHPVFHEHPPLVFWIQSLFFRIFGNGPYLEAFYGFFIGLLILFGTGMFWQQVRRDYRYSSIGSWWPMMLLVPLPLFTYIMQVNRVVNTWTLLAIIAAYLAYLSLAKTKFAACFSILAGAAIYLGFIAKGPVAFFPFAIPLLACLILKRSFAGAIKATLISTATFAVILMTTFYIYPDSFDFWRGFWHAQVMASLKSERGSTRPHWHLLHRWISEMIVPFLIAAVFMLAFKVPFRRIRFDRRALFFLFTALASSLPFLVSTRQHGRYIFHAYPFFILCLAFVTQKIAVQIETVLTQKKVLRIWVGIIAAGFLIAAFWGMLHHKNHIARRKPFYHDIYLQKISLPERITISACPEDMIYHDWLFADMQRFYRSSLTAEMDRQYLIIAKNSTCTIPEGYQRINREPALKYLVYKKSPDR